MQLFALDQNQEIIFAKQAIKKLDYFCLECGGIIRLREGAVRQPHFYHFQVSKGCRQNSKSLTHINLQLYIQKQLGTAKMEVPFPSISRIADVAWEKEKIVFEIQCSPMTSEEMRNRVNDYQSVGYQVVWILHDRRYNQWRLSALEAKLTGITRYFTNMNASGEGEIYDQWEWIEKGIRKNVLPPLKIDINNLYRNTQLGFLGDLGSLPEDHPYKERARVLEKEYRVKKEEKTMLQKLGILLEYGFHQILRPFCG